MRRSDLILYLGILMLGLGLISWFVTRDRPEVATRTADAPAADAIPEIPESPDEVDEAAGAADAEDGVLGFARNQLEAVRREGDHLAQRVWKDGLTDGQRSLLTSFSEKFGNFKDFTLSLHFLLVLVSTALLVGIYHLVSSGKLQRLIRRRSGPPIKP